MRQWLTAVLLVAGLSSLGACGSTSAGADAGGTGGAVGGTDAGTNTTPCTGDVTLLNAQAAASFVQRGCTSLTGTLTVGPSADITELSLQPLATLQGSLVVMTNPALATVALPGLVDIGGSWRR